MSHGTGKSHSTVMPYSTGLTHCPVMPRGYRDSPLYRDVLFYIVLIRSLLKGLIHIIINKRFVRDSMRVKGTLFTNRQSGVSDKMTGCDVPQPDT